MVDQKVIDQLFDELASEPINILRIRQLCKDNPGLIATAGLRIKLWTLLLLGNLSFMESTKAITVPELPCMEQQVLDADVRRTRGSEEEFRSTAWRTAIQAVLQTFCLSHSIQYKQGMNEVLAPFIFIHPPPSSSFLSYALFEAFLFRYLERYFYFDESSYLFKAFRYFHLLLVYFDPQLALYLHDNDYPPELYGPQWFLTLYSRTLPLQQVLRLWDMIITVDDPAFTFFIGLCLIRRKREDLLLSDPENIPEIMAKIHFNAEEEIDSIVIEALKLYKTTPRCLLRSLRLCCVSTIELTPALPAAAKSANSSNSAKSKTYVKVERSLFDEHERTMAIQAARSYLMMAPQELVNAIAPMSQRDSLGSESIPAQYVLIDIRSFEESVVSGGGTIPRAIQLEPEFLNRPEAFNIWLQHFDGTRGCNICIIDLPPANWSGMALWRRILLGDGDGIPIRTDFDSIAENERKLLALTGFGKPKGSQTVHKERVSPDEEAAAAALDMNRPAVILALALQRNSFPNVSVLEGGFPALVEQLLASRGSTEPIVINHDQDKWKKFLNMTGRAALVEPVAKKTSQEKITEKGVGKDIPKTVKDLSQLEVYQLALRMAERLGHNSMAEILREKVNTTPGQETPKSSTPISVDSSMPDELSLLI